MKEIQVFFSHDLYEKKLSTINNIHFTVREIDVIACILSAKKTKKVADFLFIKERTVETHINNIMSKLNCNTRESIIDFIETSEKIHFLRTYYSLLQIETIFKKSLKDISELNQKKVLHCFIMYGKENNPLIAHLKSHLNMVGITISDAARNKEADYLVVVLPKYLAEEEISSFFESMPQSSKKILCLSEKRKNNKENPKEFRDFDIVDFTTHENYYFSFLIILKKILPNHNLDEIISEFKAQYSKIHTGFKVQEVSSKEKGSEKNFVPQIKGNFLLKILCGIGLLGSFFLAFYWSQKNESYSFRSDLLIPIDSALLQRPDLIAQIDDKLKGESDIQTVALVGPGGAGKTTLARQYARQQKTRSLWEINAETGNSLNASFEKLAQALAKTKDDKKALEEIQAIKYSKEKEEQIIQFVKDRLKLTSNWILIFDNVEIFTDIQKHFPHDSATWGMGKIILTTRDHNIENNKHIKHAISLGELTLDQKLNLFTKIMTNGTANSFSTSQIEEAKHFLEKIPPFPLDVSVAAYYLKATNVSYSTYLDNLNHYDKEFAMVQKSILKEVGSYTKERYSIITLSLKKLLDENKDFIDLLLLISLLDSQNIPIDLLKKYKWSILVDNFLFNLKKYSLVSNEISSSFSLEPTFSLHRSTQEIILAHLISFLNLEKNKSPLQEIIPSLENYTVNITKEEDFQKIRLLPNHFEAILKHKSLLTDEMLLVIRNALGPLYYHLCDYEKARENLKESLLNVKFMSRNDNRLARALSYLGIVERESGCPEIAKNLLEQSLTIYKKIPSKNSIEIGRALTYLGISYRDLGKEKEAKSTFEESLIFFENYSKHHVAAALAFTHLGSIYVENGQYEKGKDFLEKALLIYKSHSENYIGIVKVFTFLGDTYWKLGKYNKAKNFLEKSYSIYKTKISENHVGAGWALAHLGSVYVELGLYEKAENCFNRAIIIYRKHFSEDHAAIAWASSKLANIYILKSDYEKARNLLERSYLIFRKEYGEYNIRTFIALENLGIVYARLGDYTKAKKILQESLITYEKYYGKNHIETARVLRNFGLSYLCEGQTKLAKSFLNKALEIFQQANHPDAYLVLEDLAELYLKKFTLERDKVNLQESQNFKTQAISYFNQALEIVKANFPKNSSHLLRIQNKLKNLE